MKDNIAVSILDAKDIKDFINTASSTADMILQLLRGAVSNLPFELFCFQTSSPISVADVALFTFTVT